MRTNSRLAPDLPPEARDAFKRIVKLIGDRLRPEDAVVVSMLAQSWATWQEATKQVAELGYVVSSGGTAIQNPWLSVQSQAAAQIKSYVAELGLSPAARKKLKIDTEADATSGDWLA